jgi:hypothetical protein
MVEHQVRAEDDRLGDHSVHRVESQKDRPDLGIRVADSQSHGVPGLGQGRWPQRVEDLNAVTHLRMSHAPHTITSEPVTMARIAGNWENIPRMPQRSADDFPGT